MTNAVKEMIKEKKEKIFLKEKKNEKKSFFEIGESKDDHNWDLNGKLRQRGREKSHSFLFFHFSPF